MASTSRALRKRVEDAEIFQVLEESTDSDVTIFSSEEEEDGNESNSDEDGQLDDNSETNEDGGTCTSDPPLQHTEQATDQTKVDASADWYIHVSQVYRQKEMFAYRNCIRECSSDGQTSLPFPYFTKNIRPCKSVCFCIEKKKKGPSGKGKETTYKCKRCDLPLCRVGCFWNTTSSEMWRCKIRRVDYYMYKFIRNKMKKELSFCLY